MVEAAIFTTPWFWAAAALVAVAAGLCALVGSFLMLRRMSLLSDAVSHSVLPGVVAGYMIGGYTTGAFLLGAVASGLACVFFVSFLIKRTRLKEDAAMGVVFTALIQSSTAATLTVIGFVSAGLVTFPQAVGVIVGATLGTTTTPWMVAFFGFRVSVSSGALPLLGVGAFLWLIAKGKLRPNRFGIASVAVQGFLRMPQASRSRIEFADDDLVRIRFFAPDI